MRNTGHDLCCAERFKTWQGYIRLRRDVSNNAGGCGLPIQPTYPVVGRRSWRKLVSEMVEMSQGLRGRVHAHVH